MCERIFCPSSSKTLFVKFSSLISIAGISIISIEA